MRRRGKFKGVRRYLIFGVLGCVILYAWWSGRSTRVSAEGVPIGVKTVETLPSSSWQRSLNTFPERRTVGVETKNPGVATSTPISRWEKRIPETAIVRYHPVIQERDFTPPQRLDDPVRPMPMPLEQTPEPETPWTGPVAPFGRILQVELVNAIDSSLAQNPVIGLVTHDFYWEGHLLIPAGTEVHGVATTETVRQSLMTGTGWQLVFLGNHATLPNGWVVPLQAVALERQDTTGEGRTFGWSDMRMGLPGIRMQAGEELDLKLFLSGFLGAAASTLQSRRVNSLAGVSVVEETAENAALGGVVRVLQQYGERIMQEIERVGFYLRVRAGTQFYLLVQEPLDLNRGSHGGVAWAKRTQESGNRRVAGFDLQSLQRVETAIGEQWEDLWKQYMSGVKQ